MTIAPSSGLFGSELWNRALESYGSAARLTIKLFDSDGRVVLGPIHSTPLFQLFEETTGYDPGIFAECARRCLAQDKDRSAVMVSEFFGLSVIGTSLALNGEPLGAAVGGYAFVDFSQLSEVQRLARNSGIAFERLWEVARAQKPVPQRRLMLEGELLQVLGDALLRENYRTRQHEQTVLKLEESARENARVREELRRAASALSLRNDDLQHFAYAASHDLQEPLRVVTAYSQLLVKSRNGQLDAEVARWVGYIEESAGRISGLLTDLRAYIEVAEPEGESSESDSKEPIELNRSLDSAVGNLKAAIEESGANISSDPLPVIRGQSVHFVQLFQNLIGNAIKYRGAATPRIRISVERFGGQWTFAVADNGIGIDPEYHRSIFSVFKRLHGRDIPGTGMGLAICERIVEHYRGRIWVESQPGAGATFYFTLPVADSE
jgi:signal transduction histidine kinase